MNVSPLRFGLLFLALVSALSLRADDLGAVKQRMAQRLAQLDALRVQGAIGENNRGLTEVREASGNAAGISADENRDRTAVYSALAAMTKTTAEEVGRRRAADIAKTSVRGVWLQRDNGEWYRK